MRERYRKKLDGYLEVAPDEGFIHLIWAANLLQLDHEQTALRYLKNVHPEAITTKLFEERHLHKWELETLVNELLIGRKRNKPVRGKWRELDCSDYNAIILVVNALRALENAEAGTRRRQVNIREEMPKISARQFDWQRGWLNMPQFYRSTYIYGTGAAADYFEKTHGLTVNDFSLIGFALYTHFCDQPVAAREAGLGPLPFTPEAFQAALRLICMPAEQARLKARALRRPYWPVAHQPSVLRTYPCLAFGEKVERIRSPLPQLILERVTSGIFYDVAGAGGEVREEYGRRFERYALRYLRAMLPRISWQEEHAYRFRKSETRSPDLIWLAGNKVRLAIECKATRMSIDARYADDRLNVRGYDDLVKAIFQLWRYFSHCRRGLTGYALHENAAGLVLTLESWLVLANSLIPELMAKAAAMAKEKDPEIIETDRRPILFCAITDLEHTLSTATEATFEAAIDFAIAEKRMGWLLSSSHDDVRGNEWDARPFPFAGEMAEVLPWWDWVADERERRSRA